MCSSTDQVARSLCVGNEKRHVCAAMLNMKKAAVTWLHACKNSHSTSPRDRTPPHACISSLKPSSRSRIGSKRFFVFSSRMRSRSSSLATAASHPPHLFLELSRRTLVACNTLLNRSCHLKWVTIYYLFQMLLYISISLVNHSGNKKFVCDGTTLLKMARFKMLVPQIETRESSEQRFTQRSRARTPTRSRSPKRSID